MCHDSGHKLALVLLFDFAVSVCIALKQPNLLSHCLGVDFNSISYLTFELNIILCSTVIMDVLNRFAWGSLINLFCCCCS